VTAYNTSFLLAYIVVLDISIFSDPGTKKKDAVSKHRGLGKMSSPNTNPNIAFSPTSPTESAPFLMVPGAGLVGPVQIVGNPPKLLEMINRHGLVIFLIVCSSSRTDYNGGS